MQRPPIMTDRPAALPRPHGTLTLDLGEGPRAYALIPLEELEALANPDQPDNVQPLEIVAADETEDHPDDIAADLAALAEDDAARRSGTAHGDLPAEAVERLIAGEPPLTVLADARALTLTQIAAKAGLSQAYVSQLAAGNRRGSLRTWQNLAAALNVPLDLLTD